MRKSNGAKAAAFVGAITVVSVLITMAGWANISDPSALADAALFFAIALWMRSGSRTASVVALVGYLGERIYGLATGGSMGIWMTIVLTLLFVAAIRGAFALHRYRLARGEQPDRFLINAGIGTLVAGIAIAFGAAIAELSMPLLPAQWAAIAIIKATGFGAGDAGKVGLMILAIASLFWWAALFVPVFIGRTVIRLSRSETA